MKLALYIFTGITFLLSLFFLILSALNKEKKFYFKTLLFLALCVYSVVGLEFLTGGEKSNEKILGKPVNITVLEPIFSEIDTIYSIDLYKVVLVKTNQTDTGTLVRYAKQNHYGEGEKVLVYFFKDEAAAPDIPEEQKYNGWLSYLTEEEKTSIIGTYELEEDGKDYWYEGPNATIINPDNTKLRSPINVTVQQLTIPADNLDEEAPKDETPEEEAPTAETPTTPAAN